MLTNLGKKSVFKRLLENLSNISNKDYQMRVWIRGEGPEVDDFDETCNHFFEDTGWIFEDYKSFRLTEHQHLILKKFKDEFDNFSDNNLSMPMFWIDSPEWSKIMERAKEVLKVLVINSDF